MMGRRLALVILALAVALPLSACGRKGKPIPPEDSTYPRFYPKIEPPPGLARPEQQQTSPQAEPE